MKILIITYSREVNPGTFLQAYGVQYAMKQLFPDAQVDLFKHKRLYNLSGQSKAPSSIIVKKDLAWFKGKICAIPRRIKYEWNYARKFHLSSQEFDFFDYDECEFRKFAESYDLIVVGSDTILVELKRNGRFGLMWLLGVNTNKVLFAASAAPAKYDITRSDADLLRASFSTFKLLCVRDSITFNLLNEKIHLEKKVQKIFDPTFLVPQEAFYLPRNVRNLLEKKHKSLQIAMVNFSNGFAEKKSITEYLKRKGYFVVSTIYNQWADKNLMTLSPFEWAGVFREVDLVVTERFHDSVFSLRNNRPVIAIDWMLFRFASDGSSKTKDLLQSFGLESLHKVYHDGDGFEEIRALIDDVIGCFNRQKCMSFNVFIEEEYKKILRVIKERLCLDKN